MSLQYVMVTYGDGFGERGGWEIICMGWGVGINEAKCLGEGEDPNVSYS